MPARVCFEFLFLAYASVWVKPVHAQSFSDHVRCHLSDVHYVVNIPAPPVLSALGQDDTIKHLTSDSSHWTRSLGSQAPWLNSTMVLSLFLHFWIEGRCQISCRRRANTFWLCWCCHNYDPQVSPGTSWLLWSKLQKGCTKCLWQEVV